MILIDVPLGFFQALFAQPVWLQLWVGWLIVVNSLSLAFLRSLEGRVTLIVWLCNGVSMMVAFGLIGWSRGLGIPHVIWWTPLLPWLFMRLRSGLPQGRLRTWIVAVLASDGASLVIDYVDVVRYLTGNE